MQKMIRIISICFFFFSVVLTASNNSTGSENNPAAALEKLTVEKIMRDPKIWIGTSPSGLNWSLDGSKLYFNWNPEKAESDSLYYISKPGGIPQKVSRQERLSLPPSWGSDFNRDRSRMLFSQNGDIYLLNLRSGERRQITQTMETESNPRFTRDENVITFQRGDNLFKMDLAHGKLVQLVHFQSGGRQDQLPAGAGQFDMEQIQQFLRRRSGPENGAPALQDWQQMLRSRARPERGESENTQNEWLQKESLKLSSVLAERKANRELARERREAERVTKMMTIQIQNKSVQNVQADPLCRYVTFTLFSPAANAKTTIVPSYVTESGYTETLNAYAKVGAPQGTFEMGIYDIKRDTLIYISAEQLPGIEDQPDFAADYSDPEPSEDESSRRPQEQKVRDVAFGAPFWSDDGKYAALVITSLDRKDRWIMRLLPETGGLELIDRQRDEAWIGGPGISGWRRSGIGWMPDNKSVWFQSEETGYSHLYSVHVETKEKKALTTGNWEVYDPQISQNKRDWYFTANIVHPGVRHFYRMPVHGGNPVQITFMEGNNEVSLSPDEKTLAIRFSASDKPWELYLQPNRPGANAERITHSITDEFKSYPWRKPDVITFKAEDGAEVYARLYTPDNPAPSRPAVIFVHGAGYLQNVHKWWSSYFREYMFHHLLAENGYYVLDIDYRGSAGYGRDWRTAIYRHMGGKDLSDHVDGAKYLINEHGVNPDKIGIYGGSYGGFITLMAMFTEPEVFSAGAALRSVTDWAHYHHNYTGNILNTPVQDSLAFYRSSPIYFAEGLEGALLMCHGMIDTNVHFQDIVRLAQRLIELGKDNWELAVYPLEGHAFIDPSSWTDEYKRIFKLFEDNLK